MVVDQAGAGRQLPDPLSQRRLAALRAISERRSGDIVEARLRPPSWPSICAARLLPSSAFGKGRDRLITLSEFPGFRGLSGGLDTQASLTPIVYEITESLSLSTDRNVPYTVSTSKRITDKSN